MLKNLFKNLSSADFVQLVTFCLINLALLFSVLHRGGISLQAHIVFAGLIGFSALLVFLSPPLRKEDLGGFKDIFLIIFSIFFLFSFFFSETRNYGLMEVIEILGGISIFFIISKGIFDQKWVERFFKSFVILGILSTLIGFWAYLSKPFDRFAGTFQDFRDSFSAFPNAYADFLLMLLPFMAWMFFKAKNSLEKVLWAVIFLLNLSGFVLAESKGAMIALMGMGVLVMLWWVVVFFQKKSFGLLDSLFQGNDKQRGQKDIFVFILICLFAFGLSTKIQNYHEIKFPEQNLENLSDEQIADIEQDVSESSRKDFWKGSIEMIRSNDYSYLFGYGPYSFKFIYPQYQEDLLALSDHPHNIFLKYLVENGFLATLSFLIFLILVFGEKIYLWLKNKFKNADSFELIAFLGLSAFLAHQLIDYNLNFTSNVILFWFLMGVIASKGSSSLLDSLFQGNDKPKKLFAIFYILYSIFLLSWSVHDGYYSYIFQKARAFEQSFDFKNAYIYYQKSENIWLKRDHSLSFAKLLVYSNVPANIDEAFHILRDSLRLNNQDARVFNQIGLIYLNEKYSYHDDKSANHEFGVASQRDPANNLEYYYNALRTRPDEFFDERYSKLISSILSEYLSKLKLNAYNTILTENPDYAILISEEILFRLNINCADQEHYLCNLMNELIETKEIEEAKLSTRI